MTTLETVKRNTLTRRAWGMTPKLGMWIVALAITVVYVWAVNYRWWPTPDSALYLGLGKNIADGKGYVFNGVTDNSVTPGLPLIVAAARILTGGDGIFALNLFMAVCGLGAALMIYKSLSLLENRLLGFATAVCTVVGVTFFEYSHRILTDMPFIALAYAILYACLRYLRGGSWAWLVTAGLLAVVSLTIRVPGAVLLGPMALGLLLPLRIEPLPGLAAPLPGQPGPGQTFSAPRRRAILTAGVLLAVVLGMTAMWFFVARSINGEILYVETSVRHINELAPSKSDRVWQVVSKMWENLARILVGIGTAQGHGIFFSALIMAGMACLCAAGRFYIPFVALVYTAIMVAIRRSDMPDRYLLPVIPLYIFAALYAAWTLVSLIFTLASRVLHPFVRKVGVVAGLAAAGVVCWIIVGSSAREIRQEYPKYVRWPYTDEFYTKIDSRRYEDLHAIGKVLREQTPLTKPAAVEKDRARMFHYVSDHVFVLMPSVANMTAADADTLYEFFQKNTDIDVFVLRSEGPWEYQKRLNEHFEPLVAKGVLKKVYRSDKHVIYCRVGQAPTRPATAASRPSK